MSQSLSQESTQAIIAIVFGIVMFILAMITLWQGYRQKRRSAGAITTGQPSAVTSHVNEATVEDRIYRRSTRGHSVVLCRSLSASAFHKLTADSLNHLLPSIEQWSKFSNDRIQLKHPLPPT